MHSRRNALIAAFALTAVFAFAQVTSPPATASLTLNGKSVTINYAQPSVRGRKIMGGLVPYGQVWRTGANAATELKTDGPIKIGTLAVPAGTYTLYTLPKADSWQLIVNKQTGQWGTEYDQSQDLVRTAMKVSKTDSPVEKFTIRLAGAGSNRANLVMEWENTAVSVPVSAGE